MAIENEKNKKKKPSLAYIFGGNVLTEDFIVKQSLLFFLVVVLILIFITHRYYCSKKLTEMDILKRELVTLQNEQVALTRKLATISQQAKIEELLREKGSSLKRSDGIVYQIKK